MEQGTRERFKKHVANLATIYGKFTLRSGQTSDVYFDKYLLESEPYCLEELAKRFYEEIKRKTLPREVIVGLELGGVPLATALSLHARIPVSFARKQAKDYGLKKIIEGASVQGKCALVIEDVITTGGAVLKSVDDLRAEGAVVRDVMCVVFRGDDEVKKRFQQKEVELHYLFTKDELTS